MLACEAVVVGAFLALQTHMLLLVCVGQSILQHAINERLVAKLGASSHVWKVVRHIGHALCATCDNNVRIASDNCLRADDKSFDARGADLVHGGGYSGFWKASADCALAGGVLTETRKLMSA